MWREGRREQSDDGWATVQEAPTSPPAQRASDLGYTLFTVLYRYVWVSTIKLNRKKKEQVGRLQENEDIKVW